uniref:Uncharacterized protein n=1 Tax=Rhizophora mucronata TaxID=61149 RepID=A0A2P2NCT2_RHIMU
MVYKLFLFFYFYGTPCQILGLSCFCKKKELIGEICHKLCCLCGGWRK